MFKHFKTLRSGVENSAGKQSQKIKKQSFGLRTLISRNTTYDYKNN